MLGAVAFSQNPSTFKTLTVSNFQWSHMPSDLIVINAPTKATVRVTGLADAIQTMTADRLQAIFDLSNVKPGPAVKVNLVVTSQITGVTVQNSSVPFALNIDRRATVPLTLKVRPPRAAPGYVVTKVEARCSNAPATAPVTPCVVRFDGPASWENDSNGKLNLNAYVELTAPVNTDKFTVGNLPVSLEQSGTPLDAANFTKTVPVSGLDVSGVEVQVEAMTATTSKPVVLYSSPSHGPPPGYRVTGIAIIPIAVVITGRADALAKIQFLTLPDVDLSGHTSDFNVTLTIPYPAGVSGSAPSARVTYSISAIPKPQGSPSPTPTP